MIIRAQIFFLKFNRIVAEYELYSLFSVGLSAESEVSSSLFDRLSVELEDYSLNSD